MKLIRPVGWSSHSHKSSTREWIPRWRTDNLSRTQPRLMHHAEPDVNLRYLTLTRLLLTFFISNWKYIHGPFFLPPHICLYIFVSEYLRCDRSVRFHLRIYDPTLDRTDKKTLKNVYLCSVGVDPWDSRVLSAALRPRLRVLTLSFFSAVALDCVEIAFYPSLNPAALRRC